MDALQAYFIISGITLVFLGLRFKKAQFFNILIGGYAWPITITYLLYKGKETPKIFQEKEKKV